MGIIAPDLMKLPTKESQEFYSLSNSLYKKETIEENDIVSFAKHKHWLFLDKNSYKSIKKQLGINNFEKLLLYSLFYNQKDEKFYKLFTSEFKNIVFSNNNENYLNFVCLSGDDYLINHYKNDIQKKLTKNQSFLYSIIFALSKNNNKQLLNIIEKNYDLDNYLHEKQYTGIQRTPNLEKCLKNDLLNNLGSQILIKERRGLMGFWVTTKSPDFINQFMCAIYESNLELFNYLVENHSIFNDNIKINIF